MRLSNMKVLQGDYANANSLKNHQKLYQINPTNYEKSVQVLSSKTWCKNRRKNIKCSAKVGHELYQKKRGPTNDEFRKGFSQEALGDLGAKKQSNFKGLTAEKLQKRS